MLLGDLGWPSRILPVLLAAFLIQHLAELAAHATATLHVPDDRSLTGEEYVKRGVKDPSQSWALGEYAAALLILGGLDRPELPRASSARSGALFERLVAAHLMNPDIVVTKAGAPTLSDLYSMTKNDRLLFDRELVAIRAAELRNVTLEAPTRSEIDKASAIAVEVHEQRSGSSARPGELAEKLQEYQQLFDQSSSAIRRHLSAFLYLASVTELSDLARTELAHHLNTLVSEARDRLSAGDRDWLEVEIAGLSRLDFNRAIRQQLQDAAKSLEVGPRH